MGFLILGPARPLAVGKVFVNVNSTYALPMWFGYGGETTIWEDFDEVVEIVTQKLCSGGDLNVHVGISLDKFKRVHLGFRYVRRDKEEKTEFN